VKVALVYDRVNKWGGAERVLLALWKIFPQSVLFTSVYQPTSASWAKKFKVKSSFLQKFPKAKSSHELYALLMPIAFESFSFDDFDLVISVTSEAAKGIITKPKTLHICYMLTPTRYLWSGYDMYFKNVALKILCFPFVKYLKFWDTLAANRPDYYLAISNEVKNRIKKYYNQKSLVVYPPIDSSLLEKGKEIKPYLEKEKYFLIVSRLVYYKRLDLAIEAFNKLGFPLKIVGVGKENNNLKKLAGKNIEFLGSLTDEQLIRYYKGCLALIFPGEEDFGLTIIEAQAFGKPVIAYYSGGAKETIIEGKTGEFFKRQTKEDLVEAIARFKSKSYKAKDCIAQAAKFSQAKFAKEFKNALESYNYKI